METSLSQKRRFDAQIDRKKWGGKVAGLLTLALLGSANAAHAEWEIVGVETVANPPDVVAKTDVIGGTRTETLDGESAGPQSLTDFHYGSQPGLSWSFSTGSYSREATRVGVAVDFNGKARVILRWKRIGHTQAEKDADNPPSFVMLRVKAVASASAVSDKYGSNRMAGTEHVSASVDGATQEDVFSPNGKAVKAETPLVSIRVAVPAGGGDRVEGPWCSLKAKASLDGGRYVLTTSSSSGSSSSSSSSSGSGAYIENDLTGEIGGGVGYSAIIDDRNVRLTRSGAVGETYDATTNTTTGHTRWSYTEREDVTLDPLAPDWADWPIALSTVIGANWSGAWSDDRTYTWSPSDSRDQETSHVVDLPDGGALLNNAGLDRNSSMYIVPVPQGWYRTPSSGTNPLTISYTLKDNADGATLTAKYVLNLHDEWENPTVNTEKTWDDGTHPGQTHRTVQTALNVPRIDGPQTDKSWTFADLTAGLKATLSGSFGGNFKLKDWFNAGGSFEAESSLEITAEYAATAPKLNLTAGQSAIPCINYIIRTDHKLLDRYDVAGRDSNPTRSDGKWEKSADLPVPLYDISANWQRVDTGVPGSP